MMNHVITAFAVVGVVTITAIMLYYIAKQIKKYKPSEDPDWPDEEYMGRIGAVCPTGWIHTGKTRNGKEVCKNHYNVDVPQNGTCYNYNIEDKTASFSEIKDWKKCKDKPTSCGIPLRERCRWIRNCGPRVQNGTQVPASWIGVSGIC